MKLTWFSGTTLRIQIGGRILVSDPDGAGPDIDREELLGAADLQFALADAGPSVDPALWEPHRPSAMIDAEEMPEVLVHGIVGGALIASAEEAPLVLAEGKLEAAGRWSRDAVVVVFGDDALDLAEVALERLGPRLIAIAASEPVVDATFAALKDKLRGTGLLALEPGMALEV